MSWKTFTRTTGIYSITNKINNRRYIGQSKDIAQRWKSHIYQLKTNKHHTQSLQEDWNKFTYEDFVFQIEYICTKKFLIFHEIRIWELYENNYNGKPTTRSYPEPTKETRKKMSESQKGKKLSAESIRKRTASRKGLKISEETRKKMSEAKKGTKLSAEHRKKLSGSHTGLVQSKETIQKRAKANSKAVLQYDKEGNFIAEYSSLKEAGIQTGLHRQNIGQACRGNIKTSGGFVWKYK